jgi:hypothetical protein
MYDGLDSSEITALVVDMDGYIYAGTNGQGIYKSLKSTTGIEDIVKNKPFNFSPNPFTQKTKISFYLNNTVHTKLTIYNALGYQAAVLVDEFLLEGKHEAVFDGSSLSSGTYFFVLKYGGSIEVGKFLHIRL